SVMAVDEDRRIRAQARSGLAPARGVRGGRRREDRRQEEAEEELGAQARGAFVPAGQRDPDTPLAPLAPVAPVAPLSPGRGRRMRWPVTRACGSAVGLSARSVSIGMPVRLAIVKRLSPARTM